MFIGVLSGGLLDHIGNTRLVISTLRIFLTLCTVGLRKMQHVLSASHVVHKMIFSYSFRISTYEKLIILTIPRPIGHNLRELFCSCETTFKSCRTSDRKDKISQWAPGHLRAQLLVQSTAFFLSFSLYLQSDG